MVMSLWSTFLARPVCALATTLRHDIVVNKLDRGRVLLTKPSSCRDEIV